MFLEENALPAPEQCDVCCSLNVKLTTNEAVYGKDFGGSSRIYFCEDCRASVGCHQNTNIPLGRMADRQTRMLRTKAHDEFDKLWKLGLMTRAKAYDWLAHQLEIDPTQCHMSWLTKDQLKDVATLSADYIVQNYSALIRRKAKKDAKQQKRANREFAIEQRVNDYARRRKAKRRH